MSHHYPKALIGDTDDAWCNKCGRVTKHRIVAKTENAGVLGYCIEHGAQVLTKEQEKRRAQAEHEKKNPKLF